MLRVGLTGGLACGKSTVGTMMAVRGARVIQADVVARELMSPGQPVFDEVVRLFGPAIVHESGHIDRARLADLVFGSGRIQELNRIVHPAVIAHQQAWMDELSAREPDAIAIWEAALILEANLDDRFDKLVVVTCPHEQRISRYVQRVLAPGAGPLAEISARKEAERRIAAQVPEPDKVKAADYVIDNGGSVAATEMQVDKLMRELKSLA